MVKNKQIPVLSPEFWEFLSLVPQAYFYKLHVKSKQGGWQEILLKWEVKYVEVSVSFATRSCMILGRGHFTGLSPRCLFFKQGYWSRWFPGPFQTWKFCSVKRLLQRIIQVTVDAKLLQFLKCGGSEVKLQEELSGLWVSREKWQVTFEMASIR